MKFKLIFKSACDNRLNYFYQMISIYLVSTILAVKVYQLSSEIFASGIAFEHTFAFFVSAAAGFASKIILVEFLSKLGWFNETKN